MWASVAKIRAFAKLMKIEINIISSAFVRLMVQVAEALIFMANMFVLESARSKETIHICIRTKQRTRLRIARYHMGSHNIAIRTTPIKSKMLRRFR